MNALLKFDPMVTQKFSVISKVRLCEVVKTAHKNWLNDCSIGKEQFMMLTSENLVLQKSWEIDYLIYIILPISLNFVLQN